MDNDRRRALESKLQSLLGELAHVCGELGISATIPGSGSETSPGRTGSEIVDAGPLLLAKLEDTVLGFVAKEVLELVRMVALSDAVEPRPEVAGFVNLRGQAVPVINLRYMLALPPEAPHPDQALVILQAQRGRVGVIVDEVLDIFDVDDEMFQNRDALEIRSGFVDGVARVDDSLVAVLNPVLLARMAL